jgi:hypothetical protein
MTYASPLKRKEQPHEVHIGPMKNIDIDNYIYIHKYGVNAQRGVETLMKDGVL